MANLSVPRSAEPSPSSNYTESTASAYVPSQQSSEMSGADTIPADSTDSDAYYVASMLQQHLNYNERSSYAIGDDTMDTVYTPPAQDKDMAIPPAHLYDHRGRLKVSAEVAAIVEAESRNGYEPINMERAAELYEQNMQALENGSEGADEEAMRDMWRQKATEYLTDNRKTRAAKGKKAAAEDNSPPPTMLNSQRAQIRKSRGNHNQHGNGVGHGHQHVHHQGNSDHGVQHGHQSDLFSQQLLAQGNGPAVHRAHTMPTSGRQVLGSRNPNVQTPQNYNGDHQAYDKNVAEYGDGSEISPSFSGYDSGFSQNGYNAMPPMPAIGMGANLQYYGQQGGYSASNTVAYHDHSAPQQQPQYSLTPLMSGQGPRYQPLVAPPVRQVQSDFYGPQYTNANAGNSGNVIPTPSHLLPGANHRVRCCDRSCGSKYSKKRARDDTPKEPRAHVSYNAHNGPAAECRKADAFGKDRYRCLWGGCNRYFTCGRDIKAHINAVHIPRHQYKTAPNAKLEPNGYKCEWEKCPFVTKAARRYHLQSHILSHLGNAALRQLCVCGHTGKRMVDISKRHLPKCTYAHGHGITVVGQLRSIYGSDWPGDEDDDKSSKNGTPGASSPSADPSPGLGSGSSPPSPPPPPPPPPAAGAGAAGPTTRSSKRRKTSPSN